MLLSRLKGFIVHFGAFALALLCACSLSESANERAGKIPQKILWAWERPEDLRALDPREFGVAFLAQTVNIRENDIQISTRKQPFIPPENAYLIAVTRIETDKAQFPKTDDFANRISEMILRTATLKDVSAVQVDFDARESERAFYKNLLVNLRENLPQNTGLSITALASWCEGDRWLADLPIEEAIPMIFDMGADDAKIRALLSKGNDWREPICRKSYGISIDEKVEANFDATRKFFFFSRRAWGKAQIESARRNNNL